MVRIRFEFGLGSSSTIYAFLYHMRIETIQCGVVPYFLIRTCELLRDYFLNQFTPTR